VEAIGPRILEPALSHSFSVQQVCLGFNETKMKGPREVLSLRISSRREDFMRIGYRSRLAGRFYEHSRAKQKQRWLHRL